MIPSGSGSSAPFFPSPVVVQFSALSGVERGKRRRRRRRREKKEGAGQGKQEQKTSGLGFFPTEAVAYS